ncbi:hypothetical protein AB3N59_00115 [Leptospira sp. WS92.C1]
MFCFYRRSTGSCVFLLLLLLVSFEVYATDFPEFQLRDQRGKILNSKKLKGKTVFLLGCGYQDVVLCRKHGRKIYWRMQNLLGESEESVEFVAFLNLLNAPEAVHAYVRENQSKNYESIYLDEKGILSSGIRPNFSWLRIFSGNKKLIFESYYQEVDDRTVDKLYGILQKHKK